MTTPNKQFFAWLIWALAVLFYLYEYAVRVSPSVIIPELMLDFRITGATVGLISATYLYIYAPMQIPVGLLMDRFGARSLLSIAAIACGAGSILFGGSTIVGLLFIARLFMGLGSAFAFVGLVYVSTHWFGRSRLPWLVGVGNSIGMLGAVLGQGPLAELVTHLGWRALLISIGILGVLLGLVIALAVRGQVRGPRVKFPPAPKVARSFVAILKLRNTWINAGVAFFFYATTTAFAGLWVVPCLQNLYGLEKGAAGVIASMTWVGWIVGGPLLGLVATRTRWMKPVLLISSLASCVALCLFLYVPGWPHWALVLLLFLLGVFLSGELITYSFAVRISPPASKGVAPGLVNFFAILSGSALQPLVGWFLDLQMTSTGLSPIAYRLALTVFPLTLLTAFLLALTLRRPQPVKIPLHQPKVACKKQAMN